jgi:hypothetical protein
MCVELIVQQYLLEKAPYREVARQRKSAWHIIDVMTAAARRPTVFALMDSSSQFSG